MRQTSSCCTILDAKLFEDVATLLPGYIGTYLHLYYNFILIIVYYKVFIVISSIFG